MIFLPDTNTCISLLRQKQPRLIARWQSTKLTDIVLCSIIVYEQLSEHDLIELNRRIVERLQLLRSAKNLAQLARFSMVVEFDADDGRTISGTVARLNQRTATVVTASGRWRVSPSLLRAADASQSSGIQSARVVTLRRHQE